MPWPKCHQRRTHGTASPALLGRREPFSLALRPCCSRPPPQERAIAPRFATTSLHTLRKPRAQAAATRCAFGEAQIARTRALKAVLPKGGRFALKSPRSRLRISLRSQAQYFSVGFKSGDRGGVPHKVTLLALWAAALSRTAKGRLRDRTGRSSSTTRRRYTILRYAMLYYTIHPLLTKCFRPCEVEKWFFAHPRDESFVALGRFTYSAAE